MTTTNPWLDLGSKRGVRVSPDDLPYVEAFNNVIGRARAGCELVVSAYPEPWAGKVFTAGVLVLSANPGWGEGDDDATAPPRVTDLKRRNLGGSEPLLWLNRAADGTPGADWYRKRLLADVLKADISENAVAERLCVVDFHGYHSVRWQSLPITLPSQRFTFDTVRNRLADNVMIIITRASKEWRVAVPELANNELVFETSSRQNPRLSAKNLGTAGWSELLRRLG